MLMLSLLGAAYYIKTEHTVKRQEMQEWERLRRDKEEARRTKEEALKARGKAAQEPRQASVEGGAEDKLTARGLAGSRWLNRSRKDSWSCGGGSGVRSSRIPRSPFMGSLGAVFPFLRMGVQTYFSLSFR